MNQIWKKLISSTDYLDETDKALLKRAFEFSEHCHENQKRKSGEPYINHPLRVALTLAEVTP
jgi:GTP pyrophosphokinase